MSEIKFNEVIQIFFGIKQQCTLKHILMIIDKTYTQYCTQTQPFKCTLYLYNVTQNKNSLSPFFFRKNKNVSVVNSVKKNYIEQRFVNIIYHHKAIAILHYVQTLNKILVLYINTSKLTYNFCRKRGFEL